MKLTIDSTESVDDVIRAVGAMFGVTLMKAESPSVSVDGPQKQRRGRSARSNRASTRRPSPGGGGRHVASASDIRAWARDNGYQVGATGRVPRHVVEAFQARKR